MQKKKKNFKKIGLICFFIISVSILIVVIANYIHIKNLSKGEDENTTPVLEGALLDISNQFDDIYGFSFNCVLSGSEKGMVLPEWLLLIIGNRLNNDTIDEDSDIYINGVVYNGGADIRVSLINTELNDSDNVDYSNFIFITTNNKGTFLMNPQDYKYSMVGITEEKYVDYDSFVGDNVIMVGDGKAGRDIISELMRSIESIPSQNGLSIGKTEDGHSAFAFEDGLELKNGYSVDFLFHYPAGFSAYEIPTVANGKGFSLEGYGNGIQVSLSVSEQYKYIERYVPDDSIIFDEYWNYVTELRGVENIIDLPALEEGE